MRNYKVYNKQTTHIPITKLIVCFCPIVVILSCEKIRVNHNFVILWKLEHIEGNIYMQKLLMFENKLLMYIIDCFFWGGGMDRK